MTEKLRKAILEMNLNDSKDWFSPDALEKDEKSWFEPEIIANEYGGTNVVFVKKRPEIEVDNSSDDSEVEVKPIDSSPNSNEIEEKKANNQVQLSSISENDGEENDNSNMMKGDMSERKNVKDQGLLEISDSFGTEQFDDSYQAKQDQKDPTDARK